MVGEYIGEEWVIKEGLQGGERVVVDGLQRLAPGAPVTLAEASAAVPEAGGAKARAAKN